MCPIGEEFSVSIIMLGDLVNREMHVPRRRPTGPLNRKGRATSRDRGQAQLLASTQAFHHGESPQQFGVDVRSATSWSVKRGEKSHQLCSTEMNVVVEAHIWVRFVDKSVEHFHGLPDAHAGTPAALEVDSSLDVERNSLLFCCGCHVNKVRLRRRK